MDTHPYPPPPSEDALLIEALLGVIRALRREYDASAQAVGLTLSRARALSQLARMEGATQAELAEALGIEAPTVKRQIDALERDGFLERRGLAGDARKRALFLTDKARSTQVSHFMERVRGEILAGLTPAERRQIGEALARIAENIGRLGAK